MICSFSDVLDTAARRALPLHLLRRCRILSSLKVGSSIHQRVAVTACSGEEVVLSFRLEESGGMGEAVAHRGSLSQWLVASVHRVVEEEEVTSLEPHPRFGPEQVIHFQLNALRDGDIKLAQKFSHVSAGSQRLPANLLLASRSLGRKATIEIVASAMPSARTYCALVKVVTPSTSPRHFVYELGLMQNGEWRVDNVRPVTV